VAGYIRSRI